MTDRRREDILIDGTYKGFFMEINEIFDYDLTSYELLVRLYLARCSSNKDGIAFPSHKTIAEAISCSQDSVKRAISGLIEKGWLLKKNRRKKNSLENDTNLYKLVIPTEVLNARIDKMREAAASSANDDPFADYISEQDEPGDNSEGVGAHSTQVGAHSTQVGAEAARKKTYLKRPNKKTRDYNNSAPEPGPGDNAESASGKSTNGQSTNQEPEGQDLFEDSNESPMYMNGSINQGSKDNAKHSYSSEFEAFWKEYPSKRDKYAAFKKYKAQLKNNRKLHDYDLLLAARKYARECSESNVFPKYAKTWLEQKSYLEYMSGTQEAEDRNKAASHTQFGEDRRASLLSQFAADEEVDSNG